MLVTHFTLCYTHLTAPPSHAMHNAAAPKSTAVLNTQLSLILNLSAPAAWQYTLNVTHPGMNQPAVSRPHYRARTRVHRFLKHTTKHLLNNKMTHCSTYTAPDLPPILAARLALCKGIHFNIYPTVKSSPPTPTIPLRLLPKQNPYSKTRRFLPRTLHYVTLI